MSYTIRLKSGLRWLLTAVLALILAGCSGGQTGAVSAPQAAQETFPVPETVTQLTRLENTLGDQEGVYAFEEQVNGMMVLTYYDKTAAVSRPVCMREGCAHNSLDCPACYSPAEAPRLFAYNGCLYVLTQGIGGFCLYRQDLQGQERTEVMSQEDVTPFSETIEGSPAGEYFDGLSLYICYQFYSTQDTAAILKISMSNNPKANHNLLYSWREVYLRPAVRMFGPVVNGKILLRDSMEELLLLDLNKLEKSVLNGTEEPTELLELPIEGGWLHAVWDGKGFFAEYDYEKNAWQLTLVDIETGVQLYHLDTSGYGGMGLDTYPIECLDMAILQGQEGQSWLADWETGELKELSLVRWRGNVKETILPIAQCGDEYLVKVREELYSNFQINPGGDISTEPVYQGQYGFISVEDYLAGQPNYRIVQKAG